MGELRVYYNCINDDRRLHNKNDRLRRRNRRSCQQGPLSDPARLAACSEGGAARGLSMGAARPAVPDTSQVLLQNGGCVHSRFSSAQLTNSLFRSGIYTPFI